MQNPIIYKHISKRTNKLYNIYEKKLKKETKEKINNYTYFSNLWIKTTNQQ